MRLARLRGSIPTKIFEWLQSLRALQKKVSNYRAKVVNFRRSQICGPVPSSCWVTCLLWPLFVQSRQGFYPVPSGDAADHAE